MIPNATNHFRPEIGGLDRLPEDTDVESAAPDDQEVEVEGEEEEWFTNWMIIGAFTLILQ